MTAIVRLSCDQCDGESLSAIFATNTDKAREIHARAGWRHFTPTPGEEFDLCPVCSGENPDYYTAEPF